jgi:hypothetical protein
MPGVSSDAPNHGHLEQLFGIIDTMLTKKKFKDLFQKNIDMR